MFNKYFKGEDQHQVVDIYEMFNYYNAFFFEGRLEKCYVEWSQKMTLCAGTCTHSSHNSCTIRLSAPLLQYRTANELKETLLHEMIHAFLFLTNPRACLSQGGHGREFQEIMRNINSVSGLNVTIYHNFHEQVNMHRKHIWRCNGHCRTRPPFYGYVKRAMNRKPQPADHWFAEHKRVCGGEFIKESAPEEKPKSRKTSKEKRTSKEKPVQKGKTIEDYFKEMVNEGKGKEKHNKKVEFKPKQEPKTKPEETVKTLQKAKTIAQYWEEMQEEKSRLEIEE